MIRSRWSTLGIVVLTFALVGCSPSTPTPTPAATGSPAGPPSPTSAPPSVAPTPSPTPTATVAPTPSPSPSPTATPIGIACTTLPYDRFSGSLTVGVADVRVGAHPGFDRIVYQFQNDRLPAILIERTSPPFKFDPSDLPVTIEGSTFLRIHLTHIAVETVKDSWSDQKPGFPLLKELLAISGFEGDSTWLVGMSGPACAHISILRAPTRLVIDLVPTP